MHITHLVYVPTGPYGLCERQAACYDCDWHADAPTYFQGMDLCTEHVLAGAVVDAAARFVVTGVDLLEPIEQVAIPA